MVAMLPEEICQGRHPAAQMAYVEQFWDLACELIPELTVAIWTQKPFTPLLTRPRGVKKSDFFYKKNF
jgi:hypothetical protein